MPKYFLYARKSTDEDSGKQIHSIEDQITLVTEYCQKENIEVEQVFTEFQTAKVPGRPIFNSMLDQLKSREVTGIVSWHPFMSTSFSFIGECRQRPLPILSWFYTRLVLVFERLKHPIGQLAFKAPQRPQLCFALG